MKIANHNFSEKLEGIGRYGQNQKLGLHSAHFRNLSPVCGVLCRHSDFSNFRKASYYKIAKNVRNLVNPVQNRNFKIIQNVSKMPLFFKILKHWTHKDPN